MLKFITFVVLGVVVFCDADTKATLAPPSVFCGYPPENMFTCLKAPTIVGKTKGNSCSIVNECDRAKCVFSQIGWADNAGNLNKDKVKKHFEEFAVANPAWVEAVNYLKLNCLERELPAQGIYLGCPLYDVQHCIQISIIKNTPPSQLIQGETCAYARSYAQHCPVCPSDCFSPMVPTGSCNACLTLPRTP